MSGPVAGPDYVGHRDEAHRFLERETSADRASVARWLDLAECGGKEPYPDPKHVTAWVSYLGNGQFEIYLARPGMGRLHSPAARRGTGSAATARGPPARCRRAAWRRRRVAVYATPRACRAQCAAGSGVAPVARRRGRLGVQLRASG